MAHFYSNKKLKYVFLHLQFFLNSEPVSSDLHNCKTVLSNRSYNRSYDEDTEWVVVNIPAPSHDVTHVATATTSIPMHHDIDEDEVDQGSIS